MFQKLKNNFLGKTVDLYAEEIKIRNYKSLMDFSVVGVVISIAVLLFSLLLKDVVTFKTEFLIMAVYFIAIFFLAGFLQKKRTRHILFAFYGVISPVMVMAILLGTFLDPTQPSITIMIFIGILPLFILDKPWRVCLYITVIAVIYCICNYLAKDFQLFLEDFIDLVAFYFLAAGVNFFILDDRLENVENYVKFREKSETDVLTGIYNRGIGEEKIKQLTEQKVYGAFCILDIDDFKYINDTYGHASGDEVLQEIAKVIRSLFSKNDVFFRMGGDEFVVYSVKCADESVCRQHLGRLYDNIKALQIASVHYTPVSVSIGCCIYNQGSTDYSTLYKCGDKALYQSKHMGKGHYTIRFLETES